MHKQQQQQPLEAEGETVEERFQMKLQQEIRHIKDKLKLDFAKEVGGLEVSSTEKG